MNRRMMIASLPTDELAASHFVLEEAALPEPDNNQVLCRTLALTIGAGQRAGLQGSASYAGAPEAGRVMGGTGIARVEASRDSAFAEGDVVRVASGWQDYSVHDVGNVEKVDPALDPALHLGVLGTNGLTAYFGLLRVGALQAGETVLVSAAAGSVGHFVGQLAVQKGARVIGVAGSDEKCALLENELGFDVAINRRSADLRTALADAAPDRLDLYFDNTGGPILQSALFRMRPHGRIVCCGVVSQYDTSSPQPGPKGVPGLLVNNRVRMEGFLVFDFKEHYGAARQEITGWIDAGGLVPRISEYDGLERAGEAFVDLLAGRTIGTTIVRVA